MTPRSATISTTSDPLPSVHLRDGVTTRHRSRRLPQQDLQDAIHSSRAAAASQAAAQKPTKQVWRTVMPPLRHPGAPASAPRSSSGAPAWPRPGLLLDQVWQQVQVTLHDRGRHLVAAGCILAALWFLSSKSQCAPCKPDNPPSDRLSTPRLPSQPLDAAVRLPAGAVPCLCFRSLNWQKRFA